MQNLFIGENIFVGNLAGSTTEETLRDLFLPFGTVLDTILVRDRDSGTLRGFAFVQMESGEEAAKAVAALNGTVLEGRSLRINLARPKAAANIDEIHEHMRRHRQHRL